MAVIVGAQTRALMRRVVFAVLVCLAAPAVATAQFSLVSVQQEIEIGQRVNAQVRKEMPILGDAAVTAYVRGVGDRLVGHAPGPKYPYGFGVVDYREINAFALPGGPIWVHRGLMQAASNESQVAGVLAHEVAHVAQRHAADQLTKSTMANWGLGLLGAMLGNSAGAAAAQTAAGFLANGVFLKFSRDDEREADRVGLQILTRAGWDPRGMVELFEVLRREASRNPGSVDVFFSSHPSPQDRIDRLKGAIGRAPSGRRDSAQFQTIKARLGRLPAPRPLPK
jgi:predicted Zn-dependent protease